MDLRGQFVVDLIFMVFLLFTLGCIFILICVSYFYPEVSEDFCHDIGYDDGQYSEKTRSITCFNVSKDEKGIPIIIDEKTYEWWQYEKYYEGE